MMTPKELQETLELLEFEIVNQLVFLAFMEATELDLEEHFREMIEECKGFGYKPRTLISMLDQLGAKETAIRLINQGYTSTGFMTLLEEDKLYLTVEAIVHDNKKYWEVINDSNVIQRAKDKLEKLGYNFPDH